MPRTTDPAVIAKAQEMRASGLSYNVIARELGYQKKTCIRWCNPEFAASQKARRAERDARPGAREARLAKQKAWVKANYEKHKNAVRSWQQRVGKYSEAFKANQSVNQSKREHYKRGGFSYFEAELGCYVELDTSLGIYPGFWSEEEHKEYRKLKAKAKKLTKETGIEHHLDHILPMSLGGAHAPYNIQIITKEENLTKSNTFRPEDQALYAKRIFELMK